ATLALTAETPRRCAVVPVGVRCQENVGAADPAAAMVMPATASTARRSDVRFSMVRAYPLPSTSTRATGRRRQEATNAAWNDGARADGSVYHPAADAQRPRRSRLRRQRRRGQGAG